MTILQQTRVQRQAVLTYRNLQEKMRQWEPLTFWDLNSHGPTKAPGSLSSETGRDQERSWFWGTKGSSRVSRESLLQGRHCHKVHTYKHQISVSLYTFINHQIFADLLRFLPGFLTYKSLDPKQHIYWKSHGSLQQWTNLWHLDIEQRSCSWEKKQNQISQIKKKPTWIKKNPLVEV